MRHFLFSQTNLIEQILSENIYEQFFLLLVKLKNDK